MTNDLATRELAEFSDLPLELVFEVTRFNVPLAQLTDLRPGLVLTPSAENMNHVDIRVDGTLLALGDITSIKGHYGVCILQLPSTRQGEA